MTACIVIVILSFLFYISHIQDRYNTLGKVEAQIKHGALVLLEKGHTMVYISGYKGREIHSGWIYKKLVMQGHIKL